MFGDTWFCQRCGDIAFQNWHKPIQQAKHPEARNWQEWQELEQQPGNEVNQESIQLAPIPPYPTTTPEPERSTGSGTPLPERVHIPEVQPVRDPEREYVPVSASPHSPIRTRTRPFLPARRVPEHTPVQVAPISTVHEVQTETPPYSSRPSAKIPDSEPKTLTPVHQKELTSVKEVAPEKIDEKLSNQPQNVNFPIHFSQPNFKSKLTKKVTFRGRKGRQRTNAEVIELLTFVQTKGVWPNEISDQMQRYYKREYPEYFRKSRKRKVHA